MLRKHFLWFYVINYVGTNEKILHGGKILTPSCRCCHHHQHYDISIVNATNPETSFVPLVIPVVKRAKTL